MLTWVVVPLLAAVLDLQAPKEAATRPVHTEVRVFDGAADVTASARVTIMRSGQRKGHTIDARLPTTPLAPGVYDVEARHVGAGGLVKIRRAERLTIVHYADEGDRHLEVINFDPAFGALQLRASHGRLDPDAISLLRENDQSVPAARPIAGPGYVLFVVRDGRYNVRVQHVEPDGAADTHWLIRVEVPAGSTRLKLVGAGR